MFDLAELLAELSKMADEKYRVFNESLTPGAKGRSLGVRMPELRKATRRILEEDPAGFLDVSLGHEVQEINLLHAIVLAKMECSLAERLRRLEAFVPEIGNWAVCDVLCNDLKPVYEDRAALMEFLKKCIASGREFEVRFGYVMLMLYYQDETWIGETMRLYGEFRHDGYYARMGAAWGLSMLFVAQRERVMEFLQSDSLDGFTHNMAIRKACESYQVSEEDKAVLRMLRR